MLGDDDVARSLPRVCSERWIMMVAMITIVVVIVAIAVEAGPKASRWEAFNVHLHLDIPRRVHGIAWRTALLSLNWTPSLI